MIDEQEFRLKVDECFRRLYRALANASDEHEFETDLGDALTVEFESPKAKFVVSPNAPVRQIWVSAQSRSFKLDFDAAQDTFVLSETGQTLTELMEEVVGRQLGNAVSLK